MIVNSEDTMPAMIVTSKDSYNPDQPSFKKGRGALRDDAVLSEKKESILDSSVGKELSRVSFAEREKAVFDLHGVADVIEETPEFVDKCLSDLEGEICKLEDNKNAYEMAKKVNPQYICGREFRLKFLRAGRFVPKNAAARLVGFLEEKLKLFGPKPLARELLLSDLNQDDMVLLRAGFLSIVSLKDSVGRVITVLVPFFRGESTLETRMRVAMYLLSVLAQDEETQRKGCVGIFMNVHPFRRPAEPAAIFNLANLMIKLGPIRYEGWHFCLDEHSMISKPKVLLARQLPCLRIRYHAGSLLDIYYELMTFGIPTKVLPVTDQGEAGAWQHHYDWISSRESIEANNLQAKAEQTTPSDEKNNKNDCIDVPRPCDVLMGVGKLTHLHTGNMWYQFMIDEYQERYDICATRTDKTIITSAIVMKVKESGGRFLLRKKGETNWSEADDFLAREKVANAFRGRRKSAIARSKNRV